MEEKIYKGFVKDWEGNKLLPITRGELVLDSNGNIALNSTQFLAKDGHPGLITSAEREMIGKLGGSGELSLTDVYNKLDYINSGLKFNGGVLQFFKDGTSTPINISANPDAGIAFSIVENTVNLSLKEIITATTINQFINNITVDKYGRITSISGTNIEDALSGKSLKNVTLENCLTTNTDIGENANAVANKSYVDSKFNQIGNIATGSLKFGGSIDSADSAIAKLTDANVNNYYKVTASFNLDPSYIEEDSGISVTKLKVGDTLIVHKVSTNIKFIHVPSGDDLTLSVKQGTSYKLNKAIGDVVLNFSDLFSITGENSTATINLVKVSETTDGYLSKEDWVKFTGYEESLAVSYSGKLNTGYEIGTLTIGGTDNIIYGKSYKLALSSDVINPAITFKESGSADVNITLKGTAGINVKKNENAVEFYANNSVLNDSTNYLKITDGYQIGVKLGGYDQTNKVVDGLASFESVHNLALKVVNATEIIEYSLVGTDAEKYQYGNEKLKAAVNYELWEI